MPKSVSAISFVNNDRGVGGVSKTRREQCKTSRCARDNGVLVQDKVSARDNFVLAQDEVCAIHLLQSIQPGNLVTWPPTTCGETDHFLFLW